MLFCQLAQAKSLREICGGLACTMGKLKHLGMNEPPKKSTLSYANAHRPWQMFRDLFYETVSVCKMAEMDGDLPGIWPARSAGQSKVCTIFI